MFRRIPSAFLLVFLSWCLCATAHAQPDINTQPSFNYNDLPRPPENLQGFMLGETGGELVLAGGRDTETGEPSAQVYRWAQGSESWASAGELNQPRVGGTAVSTGDGLICIGGSVDGEPVDTVTRLRLENGQAVTSTLSSLPVGLVEPGATMLEDRLYVAGSAEGKNYFLSIDPYDADAQWEELPAWSGQPRHSAVLVASLQNLYLFGGENAAGELVRDSYTYNDRSGWKSIAEPPMWGPNTTAIPFGESHIFVFPGSSEANPSDGSILAYHTYTDTWITVDHWPNDPPLYPRAFWLNGDLVLVSEHAMRSIEVLPLETNYGWVDHIVVALYLLGMVAMGLYFVRKEKNTKDYFRGGQRVPWWATGMSLFATAASAISLMAMPGKSYATDWTYFAISLYSVICLPLSMFLLAPLVRKLNISTANEYLELRFGLVARMVGSLIFIIGQILARMGPIMLLPSIAMSAITGIDVWIWILVIGTTTTLYTFFGGLSAVIWTDTVQGLVMLVTVFGCLVLIMFKLDMPFDQIWTTLEANDKFHMFDWQWDVTYPTVWMVFIGTVFITLQGIGDQNYVQRVQATPTLKDAKLAIATQMAVAVPINLILFGLGTALYIFYRQHPEQLNPVMKTDGVYPLFAAQHLPPGVSGLVIAALLAASMSTISSAICSVANLGVDDFYRRFKSDVSDRESMILARVLTALVGLLGIGAGLFLATSSTPSVWDLALIITGLVGNGIVGFFGLGLLTKRANEIGALVGLAAGMVVVFYLQEYTDVVFWLYAPIGSFVTFTVGYLVSLATAFYPRRIQGLTVYTLRAQHSTPE
ncbi:MAG: SSS sodium solute transporter superfamily protein [Puniceicoccaceae bacterium 5H]|nr:MAG: SSS sodium solute transporter superfamily protein [Puniceicoccaceae bacterium 5H]